MKVKPTTILTSPMAFKPQRLNVNVVQQKSPPDLFLVGGRAIVNDESQPPDVINYHGPIYQHDTGEEMWGTGVLSKTPFISQNSHDPFSHITQEFSTLHHNQGIEEPDISGLGLIDPSAGNGGFFNKSRPPSAIRRPNSNTSTVTGRPPSGSTYVTSRPPSGISRPHSQMGRPVSGYSRPTSGIGMPPNTPNTSPVPRTESRFSDINDPDHEPMMDVLSRLGDYTQNFTPDIPVANTDCECKIDNEKVSTKHTHMYDSDKEDSDSDDEDIGVSVDVMLKTFQQYADKGHSGVRYKAMLTLLDTYVSQDTLTDQQLNKILLFLKNNVLSQVQDACLMLLKLCAKNSTNVGKLLSYHILNFLFDCLVSPTLASLRRHALLLVEGILLHSQYKSDWLVIYTTKFLPKLLSMVRGQVPLDVKYASCCVFRACSQYEDFIMYITEDILPSVILLRNASAKFKEVYVEILTGLISHTECIPPDLVDSSAIPITVSIIREGPWPIFNILNIFNTSGPQCAALHLLSSLTTNDAGVAMVIGTNNLVTMVLCCMKESHCRKVRLNATEVMKNMCTSRKLGLCKDLMIQLSDYLVPSLEQDSLTSLSQMAAPRNVVMATRPRFDEERQMWQGLERFIDMVKQVIFREGKVETDELGLVTQIHMKPCIDVCPTQLSLLTHAFTVLQYMCLWPLDKSRLGFSANRVDLTTFTDDANQRARLSKVNRGLTQAIWDKVGVVVTDLLSSYARKFSKMCEESKKGRQSLSLADMFETQEVELIMSMLELLLCSSLCTCVKFPEIIPKLEIKKTNRRPKTPSKLKSFSSSHVHTGNQSSQSESKLKSQSDIGKGFRSEEDKLWVKENPHLHPGHTHNSGDSPLEKSKAELKHKEACTERRLLRKCLYEAGVFDCVCPFLMCSEPKVQTIVLQILRCLVQPLEERVAPKLSYTASGSTTVGRQRPQTAGAVQNANKRLNMALYRMSPDLANIIKDALGPQTDGKGPASTQGDITDTQGTTIDGKGHTGKKEGHTIPGLHNGLETIQERLQDFTENSQDNKNTPRVVEVDTKKLDKPMIDRCRPIAQQCREALLQGTGERLIKGIFNKSQPIQKHCVLLLHDLVQHGEVDTYMKLSTYGCMPQLVDFLRVHEDNELLEIMGLIIIRILVRSDNRLKQLFNRHGGPQLLLSMAQYTTGLLKQEVSTTLKTVSKVDVPIKKRPVSAPVSRTTSASRAPDVWDHIQARWQQEDQVKHVLRQWMEEDKHSHKKK